MGVRLVLRGVRGRLMRRGSDLFWFLRRSLGLISRGLLWGRFMLILGLCLQGITNLMLVLQMDRFAI